MTNTGNNNSFTAVYGSLFPGVTDPNVGRDPACLTLPTTISTLHNFTAAPYQDCGQLCNLVAFAVAAPLLFAMVALFAWKKNDYDRTRIRPWLVPLFAFLGVWVFYLTSTLSIAVGWWTFPCWLIQVSAILVVPFSTLGLLYRQSYFLLLNRFAIAVQLYGPGLLEAEDESSSPGNDSWATRMRWNVRAAVDAALVVAKPIARIATKPGASASASASATATLSRKEQLHAVRTLRYVLTGQGQLVFALITSLPYLLVAILVGVFEDPSGYLGCYGCNVLQSSGYTVIALAFINIVIGTGLAVRTHGLNDPWGFIHEGRWTIADLVWALGWYVLISQSIIPANPGNGFDPIIFVLCGLMANVAHCTLYPLWLASQAEKRGGDARAGNVRKQARAKRVGEDGSSTPQQQRQQQQGQTLGARLEDVFAHQRLLEAFGAYVASEFASENLCFVQDVRAFRLAWQDVPPTTRLARARKMFRLYLASDAAMLINVSDRALERAATALDSAMAAGDVPRGLFDETFREVERMLMHGPLERFKLTREWKELAASLQGAQRPGPGLFQASGGRWGRRTRVGAGRFGKCGWGGGAGAPGRRDGGTRGIPLASVVRRVGGVGVGVGSVGPRAFVANFIAAVTRAALLAAFAPWSSRLFGAVARGAEISLTSVAAAAA